MSRLFVLAIIINHGKQPIKTKTFQDCYKFLPDALKEYVLQLKLIVVNVHEQKREILLQMQESSLLRSVFLTYQVVESDEEKDDVLIEIFKFLLHNTNLWAYFQPVLYYLMQEGQFKEAWKKKKIDIATLIEQTQLSEEEVKYVLTHLDTPKA